MKKSSNRASDIALPVSRMLLGALGTQFSQNLLKVWDNGDSEFLRASSFDISSHSRGTSIFRNDYLASQLLAKFTEFNLPEIDRKKTALDKFKASEESCSLINGKLTRRDWRRTLTPTAVQILLSAQRKIAKALGPFSWDEAESHFGFGPGAAIGVPRLKADAYHKMRVRPSTTMSNLMTAYCAVMRIPLWAESVFSTQSTKLDLTHEQMALGSFDVVAGNRIVTVPKNAKTDRIIAIEPLMNVFVQMGIGRNIRSRLLRVGVDLRSQVLNQGLAELGSREGTLATIDLSGASDSISLRLVELLLPEDWVTALKQCRSPRGVLPDGTFTTYQKVSSMGNGYTFDLETLIFWSLAKACMDFTDTTREPVAIYGDDIVISVLAAPLLISVMSEVGFTTNKDKTFIDGAFRESCGKHYYRGQDVTPFYIRHSTCSDLSKFTLANNLRRWAYNPSTMSCDGSFESTHKFIVESVSRKGRSLRVPDGFGDVGIVSNFDESCPVFDKEEWNYKFRALVSVTKGVIPNDASFLLKCLYDIERARGMASDVPRIVPRKSVYALGTVSTTQWRDFGPWL